MELLELFHGEAVVVAGEPDEAEVAGADDGDRRFVRERSGCRHAGSDALALRDLREERVDEHRALGLRRRLDDRRPAAHQLADVLAEALAVALLERGPEALAVVRQDD